MRKNEFVMDGEQEVYPSPYDEMLFRGGKSFMFQIVYEVLGTVFVDDMAMFLVNAYWYKNGIMAIRSYSVDPIDFTEKYEKVGFIQVRKEE